MQQRTRIIISGIAGNALEFYDFSLFGIFATTLASHFFSGSNQFLDLLNTLVIFSIGFLIRPLGAIFFGYIGDQYGRKRALTLSIFLMGLSTFAIGTLPSYQQIGILAPILLLLCRLVQGFSLGGENNGSAVFILESLSKKYSGFWGALILTGGALGTMTAMFFASQVLRQEFPVWGWRLPFLAGIILSLIALYIRVKLDETPEFTQQKVTPTVAPIYEIVTHYKVPFLKAVGIGGVNGALAYNLVVYLNIYLEKTVGVSSSNAKTHATVGLCLFALLAPLIGLLSDKIGRKRLMVTVSFLIMLGAFPLFYSLYHQNIILGVVIAAVMMASFNGPSNAYLNEMFPTRIRYSGVALGYSVGVAIFGGTLPLICTFLIRASDFHFAPAIYLALIALIGMMAVGKQSIPVTGE